MIKTIAVAYLARRYSLLTTRVRNCVRIRFRMSEQDRLNVRTARHRLQLLRVKCQQQQQHVTSVRCTGSKQLCTEHTRMLFANRSMLLTSQRQQLFHTHSMRNTLELFNVDVQ